MTKKKEIRKYFFDILRHWKSKSILDFSFLIGNGQFIKQSTFKPLHIYVCIYANRQIASHTHRLQIRTSILSNYLWPMVNHVLLQFMPFNGYQMAKLQLQDLSCTQHLWFLNCFISYFLALCMSFQTLLSVIHHDQRSKYWYTPYIL